jgi:hypothetical protein
LYPFQYPSALLPLGLSNTSILTSMFIESLYYFRA